MCRLHQSSSNHIEEAPGSLWSINPAARNQILREYSFEIVIHLKTLQSCSNDNDIWLAKSTCTGVEERVCVHVRLEHLLHALKNDVINTGHKLLAVRVLIGAAGEEVVAAIQLNPVTHAAR